MTREKEWWEPDDDEVASFLLDLAMPAADYAVREWQYQEQEIADNYDRYPDCMREHLKRFRAMRRAFNAENKSLKRRLLSRAKKLVASGPVDPAVDAVIGYTDLFFQEVRMHALLKLVRNAPPAVFWRSFMRVWPVCGHHAHPHHEEWLQLLRRYAPAHAFFDDEQTAIFEMLPKTITVYRGFAKNRMLGMSWSTSRQWAKTLGDGIHNSVVLPGGDVVHRIDRETKVAVAQVRRRDIFAVFRSEDEVLLDPATLLHPPVPNILAQRAKPKRERYLAHNTTGDDDCDQEHERISRRSGA